MYDLFFGAVFYHRLKTSHEKVEATIENYKAKSHTGLNGNIISAPDALRERESVVKVLIQEPKPLQGERRKQLEHKWRKKKLYEKRKKDEFETKRLEDLERIEEEQLFDEEYMKG